MQVLGQKDWTLCVPHQADFDSNPDGTLLSYGQRALLQEHRRSNIDGCTNYNLKDLGAMDCEHVTLHAGNTLYLPKGVIHYATTAPNMTSAHITFGLYRNGNTWARILRKRCHLLFQDPVCHQINTVVEQASNTIVGLPWLGMASAPLAPSYGPNTTIAHRLEMICERYRLMVTSATLPYSIRSLLKDTYFKVKQFNAYTESTTQLLQAVDQLARCDATILQEIVIDHEAHYELTRARRKSSWRSSCLVAVSTVT